MFVIFGDLLKVLANYVYPALLLTILLCFAFLLIEEDSLCKKVGNLWHNRKAIVFFLMYFSFLLMGTIFGRTTTNPFHSVFDHLFFKIGDEKWNREIIENTLVFIPLTTLFLFSYGSLPKQPFKQALYLAFGISVFIELSQLLFWLGEFQFSDIIWNTLGGILGYVVWLVVTKVRKKLKDKSQ